MGWMEGDGVGVGVGVLVGIEVGRLVRRYISRRLAAPQNSEGLPGQAKEQSEMVVLVEPVLGEAPQ